MSLRDRPAPGPRVWIAAAFLAGYTLFFHTTFLVPDSSGTYAWGRSLLFGGDLDFTDELGRLGFIEGDDRVRFHGTTPRGVPGNPFGMGSGILWMPFLLLAQAALWLTGSAFSPAGYADLHVLAASTGTAAYGLAALLLSHRAARHRTGSGAALAAVLGCGFGTPFLAYAYHLPTYAHVPAAFGVALAVAAGLGARARPSSWTWALAGAAVGLAALIRAQHVLVLALPLALWMPRARPRRPDLLHLGALAGGFLAVFGLQIASWMWLYGSLGAPQGERFLDLLAPRGLSLLFSPWHGLLPWAPILLPALAGVALLFRRDRRLAVGLGLVLVTETWLAASVVDWWGGYAVGARRLVDLTPIFILGLAVAFDGMRRPGWLRPAIVAVGVLWNLALTLRVRTGALSPFRETSYSELLSGQLPALLRLPAYLWSELWTSWTPIHVVVHRDSPVTPRLDTAPGWLVPVTLILCWGAAIGIWIAAGRRASHDGPG